MNPKLYAAAATIALVAAASPSLAATILVDNFDVNQRTEDSPGLGAVNNSQVGPNATIIGGYRDLNVETDATGQEDATELGALNSRLEFNNDTDVTGRGWVTYDGSNVVGANPNNVNKTGLGGIDFYDGPGAGFLFEIITVDQAGIYIQIKAWDMFSNVVTYAENLAKGGGNPFVPLEAFSAGPFDWNKVGALQFFAQTGEFNDVPALDGAIGSIRVETGVIPLPASAFFLIGGIGALGALRRRRKAA